MAEPEARWNPANRAARIGFVDPVNRLQSAERDLIHRRGARSPRSRKHCMKKSSAIRVALVALIAFAGAALSSVARADEGTIAMTIYKAGWVIGGSGGSGTLTFRGRRYALS